MEIRIKLLLRLLLRSHCLQTGKLLSGPVVLKLDSGPGRIVASHASILKREQYFDMGLIILAGLPNSTSVQQEMDALYGPFKSATYARGEHVLMEKIKERGIAWCFYLVVGIRRLGYNC